jgi:CRP-like cAMP-binding protein
MKKILVIDDQALHRNTVVSLLEMANYDVEQAKNGKEGIEKALTLVPDLILCDIIMPELDGFGVQKLLLSHPQTRSIPFVFLSAKDNPEDIRLGMRSGSDDYLTKPVNQTDLLASVEVRIAKIRQQNSFTEMQNNAFNEEKNLLTNMKEISTSAREKHILRKEKVYQEGDVAHYVYWVISGTIKTSKTDYYGKSYITDIFSSGSFFGHLPFQHHSEYNETAIALETSVIGMIPKKDFLAAVYRKPELNQYILQLTSQQLQDKNNRLLQLAYASVRERVALVLLKYASITSRELDLPTISREDLASIVGTTKESLVRTLSEMKKDGLLELKGREIAVLSPQELMKSIGWH